MKIIFIKYRFWALVGGLFAISFKSRLSQAFKRIPLLSLLLLGVNQGIWAQQIPFELNSIKLHNSVFKNAQSIDLKYILDLNPDKLLAPYLIDAKLPLKTKRYGNWESAGLDGHIAGHYLSALAKMYAATGNAKLKIRLNYMISELSRCQKANKNGYLGGIPQGKLFWDRIHRADIDGSSFGLNNTWVPFYNIHKLFAGLIDAYNIGHNQQAKTVLIALSNWFYDLLAPLSDSQIQQILKTEHGGINEVFADVYLITKDRKFLELASKLSHQALLNPLLQQEDQLTGLHANTQIPKVIGFEKIGQLNGSMAWTNAADFFWKTVTDNRSVAFGGNSVREHFNPSHNFGSMIESNQGPETCNSYNMLRLSKALFLRQGSSKYLDFYEKTLYNHILSSQHPEKGGLVYFTPIRPNHYRVYSQVNTSMWCCVGSGIENHSKYGELIYSHTENDLYLNLFIPSSLSWKVKGLHVNQKTNFPFENSTQFTLKSTTPREFSIFLRIPSWSKSHQVLINSKIQSQYLEKNGFIELRKTWKTGDIVELRLDMKTRLEYLPDSSNYAAFVYGPIVLAAKTSTDGLIGLFANDSRMGHEATGPMIPLHQAKTVLSETKDFVSQLNIVDTNKLLFALNDLQLMPFFQIHDARYQMYFQTINQTEYDSLQSIAKQKEAISQALESSTIDKVYCGEQQPEVEHFYQGQKSDSGYEEGKFWRNTSSYISYQFTNKQLMASVLEIQFLDKVLPQNMKFYVNNSIIDPEILDNKKISLSFNISELIHFRMEAKDGNFTPRVYQIRLRKP